MLSKNKGVLCCIDPSASHLCSTRYRSSIEVFARFCELFGRWVAQYGQGSSCEFARASEIRMDDESGGWIVSSVDPLRTNPDTGEQFGRWVE